MIRLPILLICLACCNSIYGQTGLLLRTIFTDSLNEEASFLKENLEPEKVYRDTTEIRRHVESFIQKLRSSGFLAAGLDSISRDSVVTTVFIYVGEKYLMASIRQGNVPEEFLQGTGFRKKHARGKPFRFEQAAGLLSKILINCENNGYPFAVVKIDSIEIIDNSISGALWLEKNRFYTIDSIIIKGTATIAPVYIYNYIGISPGSTYREAQVRKISSRIRELAFVREIKPSQIQFTNKENKLFLFLENKKASQFDGIIGLLPDESKTGKYNLTGEVHLKLQNSLRRGEVIEFDWKQLPGNSQNLKVHALYPFLFNTPIGITGTLGIFKKDSTYIDVTKKLGIQYAFTGNNFLRAFIHDKSSDLQKVRGLENVTTLPDFADITTVSYGLTFHFEKLDYRLNPTKGYSLETTASTGNRRIRKNSKINPAAYEGIRLTTVTYAAEVAFDYYYSPGGRHVINVGTQSALIENPELFVNELFRIGGLKSLRGFDEESIFASRYAIGKLEYRYILEQNSFLFAFINSARYENKSRNADISDSPLGFGAGINFETGLGIMSVSYALGKQFDNPVFFRNGKVHFGIVNYF